MSVVTSRIPAGWVFAAAVIAIAGSLNIIWGAAALGSDDYFREGGLLIASLQVWGVAHLIIGALQVGVAFLLWRGHGWGAALAMFGAFLALLVNFVSIGAYPIWSSILIALDFIVVYQIATNWE